MIVRIPTRLMSSVSAVDLSRLRSTCTGVTVLSTPAGAAPRSCGRPRGHRRLPRPDELPSDLRDTCWCGTTGRPRFLVGTRYLWREEILTSDSQPYRRARRVGAR